MASEDKGSLWDQLNQGDMAKIGRSQPVNTSGPFIYPEQSAQPGPGMPPPPPFPGRPGQPQPMAQGQPFAPPSGGFPAQPGPGMPPPPPFPGRPGQPQPMAQGQPFAPPSGGFPAQPGPGMPPPPPFPGYPGQPQPMVQGQPLASSSGVMSVPPVPPGPGVPPPSSAVPGGRPGQPQPAAPGQPLASSSGVMSVPPVPPAQSGQPIPGASQTPPPPPSEQPLASPSGVMPVPTAPPAQPGLSAPGGSLTPPPPPPPLGKEVKAQAEYPSFDSKANASKPQPPGVAAAPYLPIKGSPPPAEPADSFGVQTLAVSVALASANPSGNNAAAAKPGVMPSAQSSVMSASQFNKNNRSANLEKMAATARSLENGGRGETPPANSNLASQRQAVDRFVPSPEALMDSLVTSTELPRDAVRRQVDSLNRGKTGVHSGQYPGALDNGKRGELVRKMALSLGILCFMLAGGLLYYYFYSPYGPHKTNIAAQQFTDSVGEEARQEVTGALVAGDLKNPDPLGIVPQPGSALAPGIKVHVAGAVNKPGLVTLPFEARIDDAVKAAGGFGPDADKNSVNLAKYVSDGDQIVVKSLKSSGGLQVEVEREPGYGSAPAKEKSKPAHHKKSKASAPKASAPQAAAPAVSADDAVEHTVAAEPQAPTRPEEPAEGGSGGSGDGVVFGKVNINYAGAMELLQLRGVGPETAEAIVKYRDSLPNKAFTSVDQLQNVPGIGPAKLADMRSQVEL